MQKWKTKQKNTQHEDTTDRQQETFTQAELEEILGKRLARERKKYEREYGLSADRDSEPGTDREKDLDIREKKLMAKEKLMEKGLPVGLAEFLRFDDDEALEKAIAAIAALSNHDTSNQETKGRS